MTSPDTIVVGAGIIGAAIAYELQKRGRSVTMIDRDPPGTGASFGNLGSIAITEFMPMARPSTLAQMPRWLLDRSGPIRVSPGYLPKLLPWFARFLSASRPSQVQHLEAAGAVLCDRALPDMQALMAELGITEQISQTGCLSLYASDREFQSDRERLHMLDRFKVDYEVLDAVSLRALEPKITPEITKAVLLPNNKTVKDPFEIVSSLVNRFRQLGGALQRAEVVGFELTDRVRGVRLANGKTRPADEVVLCAGAYTARLSNLLGEPMPLETERGYHTQIQDPNLTLEHSIIWPARAFMVSPTGIGIRVGGTVEMAGLDAPPNYDRAKVAMRHAQRALPNLRAKDTTEWMGHRPAFPDTIPVMSASAKVPGVFYATGHGHLGLTLAATTARLMSDLATGTNPELDMAPFRIERFREGLRNAR